MINSPLPTTEQIDRLLEYYPVLCTEGFEPFQPGSSSASIPSGGFFSSSLHYQPLVVEFFNLLAQECWLDHDYDPAEAYRVLTDPQQLKTADLAKLRSLFTWCLRGERFCEGHWGQVITSGMLREIMNRLREISGVS
jgi:hypothetical protein